MRTITVPSPEATALLEGIAKAFDMPADVLFSAKRVSLRIQVQDLVRLEVTSFEDGDA